MNTSRRRIVFLGTHGQYNIGDELLLDTFLTRLGAEHHYVVNSYDPVFTRAQLAGRFDVDVIDTARDRRRLLRELRRCDRLVFGGGSIVKELYASTGRNRYATLLMILAIVTFTRWVARKPIAMLNVGVGPLRTRRGLWLAGLVLAQVDLLTVRDAKSVATARQVRARAVHSTDAVFSVDREFLLGSAPEAHPIAAPTEQASSPAPLRVALNLNFDIENPDAWESFLTRLADVLARCDVRHPIELHGLPMQAGFKEHHDAAILDDFARRVPTIPFVRHQPTTHQEAARIIAGCDLVVSERLHAIIMASVLGVPTFVLAYDVKVRELARTLGIDEWAVDINTPFDVFDVLARLSKLVEQREPVARRLSSRRAELHAQASEDFGVARRWTDE